MMGQTGPDNGFKGRHHGITYTSIFLNPRAQRHPLNPPAGAQSRALRLVGSTFQDKPQQDPTAGTSKVRSQACQRCHSLKKKCIGPPNGPCERCSLTDANCERYAACHNDIRQERLRGVYRKTRELAKTDYATAYKKPLQYIARVQRKTGKEMDVGLSPPAAMCAEASDRSSDLPDSRWSPNFASDFGFTGSSDYFESEVEPVTPCAGPEYYPMSNSPNQGVLQANNSFINTLVTEIIKGLKTVQQPLIHEPSYDTGITEQCRDPTASTCQSFASWPRTPQSMIGGSVELVETNNVATDWFLASDANISPAAPDKPGDGIITTATESVNDDTLDLPDGLNDVNLDPFCPLEVIPDWAAVGLADDKTLKAVPDEQALSLALANENSDVQLLNDSWELKGSNGSWI
jgi:hypothetical protein